MKAPIFDETLILFSLLKHVRSVWYIGACTDGNKLYDDLKTNILPWEIYETLQNRQTCMFLFLDCIDHMSFSAKEIYTCLYKTRFGRSSNPIKMINFDI